MMTTQVESKVMTEGILDVLKHSLDSMERMKDESNKPQYDSSRLELELQSIRAENNELRQQLQNKDEEVKALAKRVESEIKKLEAMRYDYLKDISHLREYMFQKDSA